MLVKPVVRLETDDKRIRRRTVKGYGTRGVRREANRNLARNPKAIALSNGDRAEAMRQIASRGRKRLTPTEKAEHEAALRRERAARRKE